MAYQFANEQTASAYVGSKTSQSGETMKLHGINGQQTNADHFYTAIHGLLFVGGKEDLGEVQMGRSISQDVEEVP